MTDVIGVAAVLPALVAHSTAFMKRDRGRRARPGWDLLGDARVRRWQWVAVAALALSIWSEELFPTPIGVIVIGVSLSVHEGQILGVIGPNGVGKTTLFDLISGFVATDSGRVLVDGKDIAVALERHIRTRDPLAACLNSPATRHAEREVTANVNRLIDLMRLGAFANKFIYELSTGSRRIVDLACVLAHEPAVLLLDEPSSGIAQRETEALGPLLLDVHDETGAGLIVIEHHMPLITSISDEMVALELGRVIVRGDSHTVLNDAQVVASYLGTTDEVIQRSGDVSNQRKHDAFTPGISAAYEKEPTPPPSGPGRTKPADNGARSGSKLAVSARPSRPKAVNGSTSARGPSPASNGRAATKLGGDRDSGSTGDSRPARREASE